MRRLKHPNIIQFVEVFENTDSLMVVMEYAPGQELFDVTTLPSFLPSCLLSSSAYFYLNSLQVILERKLFTEEDAKPIFQQIASALAHLHRF